MLRSALVLCVFLAASAHAQPAPRAGLEVLPKAGPADISEETYTLDTTTVSKQPNGAIVLTYAATGPSFTQISGIPGSKAISGVLKTVEVNCSTGLLTVLSISDIDMKGVPEPARQIPKADQTKRKGNLFDLSRTKSGPVPRLAKRFCS